MSTISGAAKYHRDHLSLGSGHNQKTLCVCMRACVYGHGQRHIKSGVSSSWKMCNAEKERTAYHKMSGSYKKVVKSPVN